jgi:tetratricopeptide (TPR) repeat protein
MASWMARYAEAQRHLTESVAIAKALGDKPALERALQPLALAALGLGNPDEARRHLEEALALAREIGRPRRIASALTGLAQVHRAQGELDVAERLYREVLASARELRDQPVIAVGLLNLAMVLIARNAGEEARPMLAEVLGIADATRDRPTGQSVLEVCAGLAAAHSEWSRAAEFFGAAEAQTEETGLHRDPADEAFLAPLMAQARAELGAAAEGAEAAGRSLSYDEAMGRARAWLAGGG